MKCLHTRYGLILAIDDPDDPEELEPDLLRRLWLDAMVRRNAV